MRILYLNVNSLRPAHLGCYGYHRRTSPNIDALAENGLCFANCYVTDSPCIPSQEAFFGCRFGSVGGSLCDTSLQASGGATASIARRLQGAGMKTAIIAPHPGWRAHPNGLDGFCETLAPDGPGLPRSDIVYPIVEQWLRAKSENTDWFLYVNLWDAHTPYDVDLGFGRPFEHSPPPPWLTQHLIEQQRKSYGHHDAVAPHGHSSAFDWPRGSGTIRNLRDWKEWIDGYDTAVLYADSFIGRIVLELCRLGVRDETCIVVSADQGENQGELGVYGDHQTADEYTHHVPLIVQLRRKDNAYKGRVRSGLIYNLDIGATLVDLAGGSLHPSWDGRSLLPVFLGGTEAGRDFLILTHGAWSCQRSVRWRNYILIRTYHTGNKDLPGTMLFDLEADPHETTNLAASRPQVVKEGTGLIDQWVAEHLDKPSLQDPLIRIIKSGGPIYARDSEVGRLADFLRKSGRAEHADWLVANPGTPGD